ncbi:mRNA surveillance protein pelota [Candidatus Heimdallarchaeota archaeon B3_Heim]|nr:MAG: mRNA surveillance protein pelota [Candidatus Heimdallarchaeota archaeon B3_Heim]
MRIIKSDLRTNQVIIRAESPTDLYILSTIIVNGDKVIAKTSRRIRRTGSESRSGDESQRITMIIGIEVEGQNFQESVASNRLRIKGTIFKGPEQHVSIGSYHTINVGLSDTISVFKAEWSRYYLKILEDAENASKKPKIGLLAVDNNEVCIGILDNYQLNVLFQEKSGVSRKHSKAKVRKEQSSSFFETITQVIQRSILPETKNILIGGPGFVKERLADHLRNSMPKENLNIVIGSSLSGGNRIGLFELMKSEALDKLAKDFQILEERRDIDEFLGRISKGTGDVAYGYTHINQIAETGVIETILMMDSYLHGTNQASATDIQKLLTMIEQMKGKIVIISSQSEAASQLKTFGGIIALLRYALRWES